MSNVRATSDRLAIHLIREHAQDTSFSVDVVDEVGTDDLALALELMGCKVDRAPGKTLLNITPPTYEI